MSLVDMMTINEEFKNKDNLIEIILEAFNYFPEGIWDGVNYMGNMDVKHDLKIKTKEEIYGAFVFSHLLRRIREMKNTLKIQDLLLTVTHEPVIITFHRFEVDRFQRIVNLVHDYVSNDVGMISLFETDEDITIKIAAHGLGHNQGLEHHDQPIGLMYVGLLDEHITQIDSFCFHCQRRLKNKKERKSDSDL